MGYPIEEAYEARYGKPYVGADLRRKGYLCGGINGLSDDKCKTWREIVKASCPSINWLDPMRRDYRGKESTSVDAIFDGDLQDVATSEFLLVKADEPSWGTAQEMVYARIFGKKVLTVCPSESPSPWLIKHSTKIVKNLIDAIQAVNDGNI